MGDVAILRSCEAAPHPGLAPPAPPAGYAPPPGGQTTPAVPPAPPLTAPPGPPGGPRLPLSSRRTSSPAAASAGLVPARRSAPNSDGSLRADLPAGRRPDRPTLLSGRDARGQRGMLELGMPGRTDCDWAEQLLLRFEPGLHRRGRRAGLLWRPGRQWPMPAGQDARLSARRARRPRNARVRQAMFQPAARAVLRARRRRQGSAARRAQAPGGPNSNACLPILHIPIGPLCCASGLIPTASGACCAPANVTTAGFCCPGPVDPSNRGACPAHIASIPACAAGYERMSDGTCCNRRFVSADGRSCLTGRPPCGPGEFRNPQGACERLAPPVAAPPPSIVSAARCHSAGLSDRRIADPRRSLCAGPARPLSARPDRAARTAPALRSRRRHALKAKSVCATAPAPRPSPASALPARPRAASHRRLRSNCPASLPAGNSAQRRRRLRSDRPSAVPARAHAQRARNLRSRSRVRGEQSATGRASAFPWARRASPPEVPVNSARRAARCSPVREAPDSLRGAASSGSNRRFFHAIPDAFRGRRPRRRGLHGVKRPGAGQPRGDRSDRQGLPRGASRRGWRAGQELFHQASGGGRPDPCRDSETAPRRRGRRERQADPGPERSDSRQRRRAFLLAPSGDARRPARRRHAGRVFRLQLRLLQTRARRHAHADPRRAAPQNRSQRVSRSRSRLDRGGACRHRGAHAGPDEIPSLPSGVAERAGPRERAEGAQCGERSGLRSDATPTRHGQRRG